MGSSINRHVGEMANKVEFDIKWMAADPRERTTTFQNAEVGMPMPNIPEMGAFWAAMEPALQNIGSGRQSPQEALDAAARRMRQ